MTRKEGVHENFDVVAAITIKIGAATQPLFTSRKPTHHEMLQ